MTLPMTTIPGVPDRSKVKPGMAFFAGTGPPGATCGNCQHRGGWRETIRQDISRMIRTGDCQKFRRLTGEIGPAVSKAWPSCRYFEARK